MTAVLRPSAVSMPELGSQLKSTSLSPARRAVSKRKMPVGKGLIDWIRLCRSKGTDLTGVGGVRITVTPEQLAQHNKEEDCWTAVRGVVYNITAYLSFHPGSVNELMKGAGIDCTVLFNNAHAHVRISQTLAACIVGDLVLPPSTSVCPASPMTALSLDLTFSSTGREVADNVRTVSPASVNENSISTLREVANETTDESDSGATSEAENRLSLTGTSYQNRRNSRGCRDRPSPSYKLEQNDDTISLTINTQKQLLKPSEVITRVVDGKFEALVLLEEWMYKITMGLSDRQVGQCTVATKDSIAVITLRKKLCNNWSDLHDLPMTDFLMPRTEHNNKFVSCSLKAVESVTHNSKLFTFQLPDGAHMIIPIGCHVKVKAHDELTRSYTPVLPISSEARDDSTIKLLVKLYSDGRMSRYLSSLSIGDQVLLGEPEGSFSLSQFDSSNEVVLLAGGTGFTPMMKLLRHHLATHPAKPCTLLFFNRTNSDIYYKAELDELEMRNPNFTVVHILSNAGSDWQGVKGRLNKELLIEHLPKPATAQHLYMCGPIEFTQGLITMLMELEYPDSSIHPFT